MKLQAHPGILPVKTYLQEQLTTRLEKGLKPQVTKYQNLLENLPKIDATASFNGNTPHLSGDITNSESSTLLSTLKELGPWRKGPWQFFEHAIDAEWRSDLKWNRLKQSLNLTGKKVLDIGGGNGYFAYQCLNLDPEWVLAVDPTIQFWAQFEAFQTYAKNPKIAFLPLGFQHLDCYTSTIDSIICMGVLYHHPDPHGLIKQLKKLLTKGGKLYLETLIIPGEDSVALCPESTYAGMRNVYFFPTRSTLRNWVTAQGFKNYTELDVSTTTSDEQRSTEWSSPYSLIDQLDKENTNLTKEGYPRPLRLLIEATKA